nr:uncharacterized mitochondrial protein AtMg00820-like [Tanacetum cinerariifolium]
MLPPPPSSPISKSHFHALRDPNWKQAMCDEYKALIDNETWVLVPRPPNVNIVRSMWLYKHKYKAKSLSRVHNTFHVSNLKKRHADEPLAVPLDGLHFDDKLISWRSQWKLWTVKLNG